MRITFLGTGTSHGVPVINCDCPVCRSKNPKNTRSRSSVLVESGNVSIIIDVTTDFREQALCNKIEHIDAILFTHAHADHVFGLDDIRVFTPQYTSLKIGCFGNRITIAGIRRIFKYAFSATQEGGGKPHLDLKVVNGPFRVKGLKVIPVPVKHGGLGILGYRIGNFGYVTDASRISAKSMELLAGLEVLVLNALRFEPHPTHFSVTEAIEVSRNLNPVKAYFTHICHRLEHEKTNKLLSPGMALAYDGLQVKIRER